MVLSRARARGPLAALAGGTAGAWYGILIHMALAVWTVNFFVVLPFLNPAFIVLMPYPVTFASKMLFALSRALVLIGADRHALARARRHAARPAGLAHP